MYLIQVCAELNMDNSDGEIKGILEAMDYTGSKKGVIITLDQQDLVEKDNQRIPVIPFYDFDFQNPDKHFHLS